MKHSSKIYLTVFAVAALVGSCYSNDYRADFDYNSFNAVIASIPDSMADFKMHMQGYMYECYYQKSTQNNIMHVIISVVQGAETSISVEIFDPTNTVVYSLMDTSFVWHDDDNIKYDGDYKICIQNRASTEKIIYVNIINYAKADLNEKLYEISESNVTHTNLAGSIHKITGNIAQIAMSQRVQLIHAALDTYYLETNNHYVMLHSIVQSAVIVISALLQTIFIKSLFKSPSSSATDSYKQKF